MARLTSHTDLGRGGGAKVGRRVPDAEGRRDGLRRVAGYMAQRAEGRD